MTRLQLSSFAASLIVAGLVSGLSATFPAAAQAAEAPQALTRAEVRADLEAWQRAGLAEYFRGNGGPNFTSPEFQRRLEAYQAARASIK